VNTADQLAAISKWVDEHNAHRDPEAALWGRVSFVAQEAGEVIEALSGATGQNPRKGTAHTMDEVVSELLDVAVSALAAVEHITGNYGQSMHRLEMKVNAVALRAGLT
jgi:hypothetical protein